MNSLYMHFLALDLTPENYLIQWSLTLFSSYFTDINIVMRIWDNFLLEGEVFVIKTAISILKYYEIELKTCTYSDAIKFLKETKNQGINEAILFQIIECVNVSQCAWPSIHALCSYVPSF